MADFLLPDQMRRIGEGATKILTAYLEDETGTAIPLADLLTLTLSLWIGTEKGGKRVNSRNLQNVLNTNNCTFNATSGLLTWNLQSADTTMQATDPRVMEERHWFEFRWTWTASWGTGSDQYTDWFMVVRKPALQ